MSHIRKRQNGTDTLYHHLDRNHKGWKSDAEEAKRKKAQRRQTSLDVVAPTTATTAKECSQQKERNDIKMILHDFIDSNTSLMAIERESKRRILQRGNFTIPSRQRLTRALHEFAASEQSRLHSDVKNSESCVLCIDMWTSNSGENFLSVLSFYIDSLWQLRCSMIGFERIADRTTGRNIADALEKVISDAGIDAEEQVAAICSDSGSNVLSAARQFQQDVYNRSVLSSRPLRFRENYFLISFPCLMHHIHNGVKKGLDHVSSISKTITKLKSVGNWVRGSTVAQKKLSDIQEKLGERNKIPQRDIECRWHSTQFALSRLLEIHPALVQTCKEMQDDSSMNHGDRYTAHTKQEILEDESLLKEARAINNILEQIRRYSRLLESQEPFSLTFVLLVYTILVKVVLVEKEGDDESMKEFKRIVKDYLDKRISEQNVSGAMISCALDPRFIKPEIVLGKETPPGAAEELRDWLDQLNLFPHLRLFVRAYWTRHLNNAPYSLTREEIESNEEPSAEESSQSLRLFTAGKTTFTGMLREEMRVYKKNAEREKLQPLEFWKSYQTTLPLLAGAARLLMPFPASSAPAERTFSAAGLIQHRLRTSMKGETLKAHLTLKHAWSGWLDCSKQSPQPPHDTEESDEDSDVQETAYDYDDDDKGTNDDDSVHEIVEGD
jgi:hypothetical protein